jgi:hypothetical protein
VSIVPCSLPCALLQNHGPHASRLMITLPPLLREPWESFSKPSSSGDALDVSNISPSEKDDMLRRV